MRTPLFLTLFLLALAAVRADSQVAPDIQVIAINDHILAFYAGRDPDYQPAGPEKNWVELGAMDLGVATYAIYRGDEAVIYDTFTSSAQAKWVRMHLEQLGVKRFTVVLSHWHLDHVAGNDVYADSPIVATQLTAEALIENEQAIRAGTLWGPPAIELLRLPDITFARRADIYLGDLKLELHNINIHSADTNLLYIPAEQILFAGDALEDTLTFMAEIADLPAHLANLDELGTWGITKIYPNHGDPKVIAQGGYESSLITATTDYITKMMAGVKDEDYLQGKMEEYIQASVAKGWISPFEPYRAIHQHNLQWIYNHHHGIKEEFHVE